MGRVYTPTHAPRVKQAEALQKLGGREAAAYLMKMRTGKTYTVLCDFGQLELDGQCRDLLVVGPAGALPPWIEDIDKHLSADLKSRILIHHWKSGAGVGHQRALQFFLSESLRPRILILNVEALSSVKAARETAIAFLKARTNMMVIDEATVARNPSAERTKFILKSLAPLANYRRILSGLLSPKSPLDIYCPFAFLDWRILGQRSYYSFRNRYAILRPEWYGGRQVQIVDGYRNLEELRERIEPYSFVCSLNDMYDAPSKIYLKREVELTKEQKRIYQELKQYATALIENDAHVTATVVIAQIIRLAQVVAGFTRDEQGNWHDIPENKTAALIEWIEECDPSEKCIIWTPWDRSLQKTSAALQKHFGENSVARFWGGNRNTREAEEHRFKTDPECRFMIATPAAGGRGREWSAANFNLYIQNSYDLEARSQSEDRPQAVGKMIPVTYGDLITPGTVDEVIIKALRNKINLASAIDGSSWREWLI